MRSSLRTLTLATLLAGLLGLLSTGLAEAQTPRGPSIRDDAKLFSDKAINKAEEKIDAIKKDYHKDLLIETYPSKSDIVATTKEQYNARGISGICVVISKQPAKLSATAGDKTLGRAFTKSNLKELEGVFVKHFEKKEFDQGLLAAVDFVATTLDRNIGKVTAGSTPRTKASPAPPSTTATGGGFFDGIWGWVCVGVVAFLVIWFVIGLFRALRAPAGPLTGHLAAIPLASPATVVAAVMLPRRLGAAASSRR